LSGADPDKLLRISQTPWQNVENVENVDTHFFVGKNLDTHFFCNFLLALFMGRQLEMLKEVTHGSAAQQICP